MQGAPKLKVAIVGGGLAGLSTAVELLDQGYDVEIFEQRPFIGGKVSNLEFCTHHVCKRVHVCRCENICSRSRLLVAVFCAGGVIHRQRPEPYRNGIACVFWLLSQPFPPYAQVWSAAEPAGQGKSTVPVRSGI